MRPNTPAIAEGMITAYNGKLPLFIVAEASWIKLELELVFGSESESEDLK
mgnify:FL=1